MLELIMQSINKFIELLSNNKIEVYNEFSLQHELGIYLRNSIRNEEYKIQFERNVEFFDIKKEDTRKKEMDIVIYNKNKTEKYVIELKYPRNGQYPESMFSFIKDIEFCEQLIQHGFNGSVCFALVDDKLFYSGKYKDDIYKYFRGEKKVNGTIKKPTGKEKHFVNIKGLYGIKWHQVNSEQRYYIISMKNNFTIKHDKQTNNLGVDKIKQYVRNKIEYAKDNGNDSLSLISGCIHKDLGLKNAMPSVCNAMRQIIKEYPGSTIEKPSTVNGKNSSTIRYIYKII
ncbi:hypothetical protein B2H94_09960 [Clostridium sporogenes]|uniref:Restriction endonuclease n=1 Tax=Clostridium sporogenes TaxID=1509 RepID=A0ABD6RTY5_CLOSG|nr:hypothetical protein [Clostridium sporogenes]OSB19397.1 hypothetical protein B2H94_09960 [Clostridium sporogenes]